LLATTEDVAWTDTSAADGVTYTYQVYACAGDESSGGSPEKSMAHLSAPTLVSLENAYGGIQVTWSTVSGAESYEIHYKATTGTGYAVYSVTADSGSTQSVTRSLTSGTTYDFYVVACAGDSVSEASETMTILCLKAPTVTLVNVPSGIQLSWSAVTGAEEYDIYRKPENGAYALHATTTDTLWVDADVTDGAAYTYQVYARTDSYTSAGSGEKSLMWLAIPTLLSVENTSGGVQVTWRTVSGAATYRVYYKASTASTFSNYVNATAGSDSTQSVTMNLTGGTSYDFYIAAYASGSLSAASETMTILYLKTPAVTLTKTDTGVQLRWSAITGAEEYQIYRRSGDGAYALLAATEDVTWLDSDITEGVTYTYQVFARADAGVSAGSTEVVYKAGSIAACTITLSATSYTYNGTARKPTVTVKDGSTTLIGGTDYTVAYSDNTNAGTATVTVTGKGNYTGTATVTFTINKASQTVSASIASSGIQAGETTQITASTTGDGALSYQSSNTAIATVSSSGLVTGVAAGATTITVTAASTANYNSATKTVSVTVTEEEATDISTCTITLSATDYTYDGTAKKPAVTVKDGSTTLIGGTDYTVAYSDNTNAGTATVTVTGKGNYTGTATVTFTISKASQTVSAGIASSGIQAGETTQITASTTGDGALSYESSDTAIATVSSSGLVTGITAGAATITVTAASTVNYNAAAKTLDVTVTEQELTAPTITSLYNSTSGVSVGWGAVDGATEYIVWRLNNSSGKWEKCATTTGTTYLSTSPVSGTTYYYAIEAVNGEVTSGRGTQRYILYMATPKVSLENTTSGIKVSWNSVAGATSGYQVYRRTADTDYELLKQVSTSTTSYTDTTAEAGVRYYYIVRSVRGSARSAYASQYITRLTTPTNISVSNTKSGVQVTWSAVTGATSYQVWRKLSGSSSWSKVGTTTDTSYTSTGVTSGKTYVFTVKAVYNSSVSAYNTTGKTIMRLAEPTITLENLVGGLTASWNAVDGAEGYKLYRRSETGSYVLVATLDADTLTYTDKAAAAGVVYYYRVQAYNGSYTSSWTSQFNRRIGHTTLKLAKGEDGVVLTWTESGGCTGYYIYRMNEDGSYTRIKTITSADTQTWTDTDVDLTSGNVYTYIVRGYNGSSLGSYTPQKTSDFF
ncbi:MAG: Ig-like domain-containing protein, partial [Clostridiales bacterium]|nr:Ig-like domain-containing protein [Clostridiales bacterium]